MIRANSPTVIYSNNNSLHCRSPEGDWLNLSHQRVIFTEVCWHRLRQQGHAASTALNKSCFCNVAAANAARTRVAHWETCQTETADTQTPFHTAQSCLPPCFFIHIAVCWAKKKLVCLQTGECCSPTHWVGGVLLRRRGQYFAVLTGSLVKWEAQMLFPVDAEMSVSIGYCDMKA